MPCTAREAGQQGAHAARGAPACVVVLDPCMIQPHIMRSARLSPQAPPIVHMACPRIDVAPGGRGGQITFDWSWPTEA